MSFIIRDIQLKRGLAAVWFSRNPVLKDGEPGWTEDTHILKIGNGATSWNDLPSAFTGGTGGYDDTEIRALITAHVVSPTPHPAYDVDMQSLVTLFENGLV